MLIPLLLLDAGPMQLLLPPTPLPPPTHHQHHFSPRDTETNTNDTNNTNTSSTDTTTNTTTTTSNTISEPARLAIDHVSRAGREPQLLLVQRAAPSGNAPDQAPGRAPPALPTLTPTPTEGDFMFMPAAVGSQGCACVSEGVFVSALQRVHADAWAQQQQQLEGSQGASLARLWVSSEAVAKRAGGAVAERLKGASPVPSFAQWGRGMGIAWVPAQAEQ